MDEFIKYVSKEWDDNDLIDEVDNLLVENNINSPELQRTINQIRLEYEWSKLNDIYISKLELWNLKEGILNHIEDTDLKNQESLYSSIAKMVDYWVTKEVREQNERKVNRNESPEEIIKSVEAIPNSSMNVVDKYIWSSDYVILFVPQKHTVDWLTQEEMIEDSPEEVRKREAWKTKSQLEESRRDSVRKATDKHNIISDIAQVQWQIYSITKSLLDNKICSVFGIEGLYINKEYNWGNKELYGIKQRELKESVYWYNTNQIYPWFVQYWWVSAVELKQTDDMRLVGIETKQANKKALDVWNWAHRASMIIDNDVLFNEIKDLIDRWIITFDSYDFMYMIFWHFNTKGLTEEIKAKVFPDWIDDVFNKDLMHSRLDGLISEYAFELRNRDTINNVEEIVTNSWTNSIMLTYWTSHFDDSKPNFQSLCRDKNISYMVLEPTFLSTK